MREAVIENPVINSAFAEPRRHFKFDDDGITNEIVDARRPSAYFIPVAQPKKKGKQLELGTEWTDDRLRENDYINEVRAAVGALARTRLPGHHAYDPPPARVLAAARPRPAALLLSDRGGRDGHLPHGVRAEARHSLTCSTA